MLDQFEPIDNGFYLGEDFFLWGTVLSEVGHLSDKDLEQIRITNNFTLNKLDTYGLKIESIYVLGLRFQGPVVEVNYRLASSPRYNGFVDPQFWFDRISEFAGVPVKTWQEDSPPYMDRGEYGKIRHKALWDCGFISVNLNISEGKLKENYRPASFATLSFECNDYTILGKPYIEAVKAREAGVGPLNTDEKPIKVGFEDGPRSYYDRVKTDDPDFERVDAQRIAKRCIEHPNLFSTPPAIANALHKSQVMFWRESNQNRWVLSDKWDSVLLDSTGGKNSISWLELTPARGRGYSQVGVNDFYVRDKYQAKSIDKFLKKLEAITGQTATVSRYLDD